MNDATLAGWLREAPFSLALSSGYFGFFAHCGVVMALSEHGLVPQRIAGSSAGALVGGFWAAGLSPDAAWRVLRGIGKADFWDPGIGLGLLRGQKFRALISAHLPCATIEACPIPFACSVFDILSRRTRVLGEGDLATAIQASCCLPFLFQPVWQRGRPLLDGGIADRPGLAGLALDARVLYHHLGSRSPWRRRRGAQTRIPHRPGLTTLTLDGLPRCGPDRLHLGPLAFAKAYGKTHQLLGQPWQELLRA